MTALPDLLVDVPDLLVDVPDLLVEQWGEAPDRPRRPRRLALPPAAPAVAGRVGEATSPAPVRP